MVDSKASKKAKDANLEGEQLIEHVGNLTGLPSGLVDDEMNQVLKFIDGPRENLTIEQLRAAVLAYLEALNLEAEREAVFAEAPSDQGH